MHDLDPGTVGGRVVLEQQLLQHVERLALFEAVPDLLPDLHRGRPRVFGLDAPAVVAHLPVDHVLDHEALLQHGAVNLTLNGDLDLDTLRMRLRPHERGVHESQALVGVDALEAFEAERHELLGFEAGRDPIGGRVEVTLAEFAEIQHDLFGHVGRDVDLGPQAGHAAVRRVRLDGSSTFAAQSA